MEEELNWLRALLIEHGGLDRVAAVDRAARQSTPPLDTRGELALLLDELESILVDGPSILKFTMDSLGAEKLVFISDTGDGQLDARAVRRERDSGDIVAISRETLRLWADDAALARETISQLRKAFDV